MDELSGFANAPVGLLDNERTLYSKRRIWYLPAARALSNSRMRDNTTKCIYFPAAWMSRILRKHETERQDPFDQRPIPHPRLGYAGVIDERMDLELIAYLADKRPEWQIVLLGPIVKIDPRRIPHRANVHLLGMKTLPRTAELLIRMGCGAVTVCAKRSHTVYQPDQDTRILGGRTSGCIHADSRCGTAIRRSRPGAHWPDVMRSS